MPQRNSWKLCNTHQNCSRCQNCIESWKKKAYKHSASAQGLKFAMMCLMNERTEQVAVDDSQETIPPLTKRELQGDMKSACGICKENYTIGGEHNMVALPCSHTICLTCANNETFRENKKCPYCRKEFTKMYSLYYEKEEE